MDKITSHELYKKSVEKILTADFLDFEKFRGKKFFITGATGLLGTVLIDVLLRADVGVKILALTRSVERARKRFPTHKDDPALSFLEQDASLPIPAGTPPADIIVCAASNSHPVAYGNDPAGTIFTNIFGAKHAIDFAKRCADARTLFTSSVEIYGENTSGKSFAEHDCGFIDCNTVRACYNECKRLAECLFQIAKEKDGVDFVTARPCRIFGPTMTHEDSKASAQFLRNALAHEKIVLKSAGTQRFSYGYTPDAVAGLLTILQKGESGHAYNVATDVISLRDFAKLCGEWSGTETEFAEASAVEKLGASVVKNSELDVSALRALGWRPQWTLPAAITETLDILSGK